MATYCSDRPVGNEMCDFCRQFDFNGDEAGCYTGDGWCRLHAQPTDPTESCERFHCRRAAQLPMPPLS